MKKMTKERRRRIKSGELMQAVSCGERNVRRPAGASRPRRIRGEDLAWLALDFDVHWPAAYRAILDHGVIPLGCIDANRESFATIRTLDFRIDEEGHLENRGWVNENRRRLLSWERWMGSSRACAPPHRRRGMLILRR